jgi:hypothetical protein
MNIGCTNYIALSETNGLLSEIIDHLFAISDNLEGLRYGEAYHVKDESFFDF